MESKPFPFPLLSVFLWTENLDSDVGDKTWVTDRMLFFQKLLFLLSLLGCVPLCRVLPGQSVSSISSLSLLCLTVRKQTV